MQASCPRGFQCPLQLSLGVQLHSQYASRNLINILHSLGFCCSYESAREYEKCAAVSEGTSLMKSENSLIQYVADNVDHNICTLDGHGTFHGMGVIATCTPLTSTNRIVKKVNVSMADISKVAGIHIKYHPGLTRNDTLDYKVSNNPSPDFRELPLDFLWRSSILFEKPAPAWSGTMQMVHKGEHPGKSSVKFLPMFDMSSSDPSCIYSTLHFVSSHAKRYNSIPIITFDQPLWWKAFQIILQENEGSDLKSIVVRLGGFHTQMSFLESIGFLMNGYGLTQVFETVYASLEHIMSGKSISRAIRGHLLVDRVLPGL